MIIINLTQHAATPDQVAQGVVDLPDSLQHIAKGLLTFVQLPTADQVMQRAVALTKLISNQYPYYDVDAVMIGGAPYLMAPLVSQLMQSGYQAVFAYTDRVSVDVVQPDGTTKKTAIFKHMGFVNA